MNNKNSIILKVENAARDYRSGEVILHILRGISLEVRAGEILAILGPSGAGKSTLLHIMGFLDRPTSGDVVFHKHRLSKLDACTQAQVRNRSFGFVFQMYHLLPELNSLENVFLPLMIRHSAGEWTHQGKLARQSAQNMLERLGLGKRLTHRPSQLSVGECQRVAIARALVGEPEIVFCDEPTGSLDSVTSLEIQNLIISLNRDLHKTFVIVTHDEKVAQLAHRQLHLIAGQLTS